MEILIYLLNHKFRCCSNTNLYSGSGTGGLCPLPHLLSACLLIELLTAIALLFFKEMKFYSQLLLRMGKVDACIVNSVIKWIQKETLTAKYCSLSVEPLWPSIFNLISMDLGHEFGFSTSHSTGTSQG